MDKSKVLEELQTLSTCQEALAELVGAVPEGMCSTKNIATLIGYIHSQQEKVLSSSWWQICK